MLTIKTNILQIICKMSYQDYTDAKLTDMLGKTSDMKLDSIGGNHSMYNGLQELDKYKEKEAHRLRKTIQATYPENNRSDGFTKEDRVEHMKLINEKRKEEFLATKRKYNEDNGINSDEDVDDEVDNLDVLEAVDDFMLERLGLESVPGLRTESARRDEPENSKLEKIKKEVADRHNTMRGEFESKRKLTAGLDDYLDNVEDYDIVGEDGVDNRLYQMLGLPSAAGASYAPVSKESIESNLQRIARHEARVAESSDEEDDSHYVYDAQYIPDDVGSLDNPEEDSLSKRFNDIRLKREEALRTVNEQINNSAQIYEQYKKDAVAASLVERSNTTG